MPVIPPDPGKVARALEGLRLQLRELEQLVAESHHPMLSMAVANVRLGVELLEKLEQKLRASKDSSKG